MCFFASIQGASDESDPPARLGVDNFDPLEVGLFYSGENLLIYIAWNSLKDPGKHGKLY